MDAPVVLDDATTERVFSNETMQGFLRLVLPYLQSGERVLAYVLPASGRFAHMALEPWALDNLYGDQYDRIVVVIHDWRRLPYSVGTHQVSSEVVSFVETDQDLIMMMGHYDGKSYENGPLRMQLQSATSLFRDLWRHVRAGNRLRHLSLPAPLEDRAARFLGDLGVVPGEDIVTVHMREGSYLAAHRYHAFRNMTPANYEPAINHLLDQGNWVFRLGDKDSSPLGIDHPRFVDLPFLDGYEDFMDVVLLAKARFAICCSSGPEGPTRAFGTPMLLINGMLDHQMFLNPNDLAQFKRYVDETTGRPIAFAEVLDRGLGRFSLASEFEESRVMLEENGAEEILIAVREMQARLDGTFVPDPQIDQVFRAESEAFLAKREAAPVDPAGEQPLDHYFGLALPWTSVCQGYCRANPWFLGIDTE